MHASSRPSRSHALKPAEWVTVKPTAMAWNDSRARRLAQALDVRFIAALAGPFGLDQRVHVAALDQAAQFIAEGDLADAFERTTARASAAPSAARITPMRPASTATAASTMPAGTAWVNSTAGGQRSGSVRLFRSITTASNANANAASARLRRSQPERRNDEDQHLQGHHRVARGGPAASTYWSFSYD